MQQQNSGSVSLVIYIYIYTTIRLGQVSDNMVSYEYHVLPSFKETLTEGSSRIISMNAIHIFLSEAPGQFCQQCTQTMRTPTT
jgi:hypothetical protein